MPVLYVYNKIDSLWIEELDILDQLDNVVPSKCVCVCLCDCFLLATKKVQSGAQTILFLCQFIHIVSSEFKWNLEELMEEIWNRCSMLRIYTKVRCIFDTDDLMADDHLTTPSVHHCHLFL
jgi:uncharacterized protein